MGGAGLEGDHTVIQQLRGGITAWVRRGAGIGGRRLRDLSPRMALLALCAAALTPLLTAEAAITGEAAAGLGALATIGGGVLAEILTDRLRPGADKREFEPAELHEEIARRLEAALSDGKADAQALQDGIAAVIRETNAVATMLEAAFEVGNERVRADIAAWVKRQDTGFADLGVQVNDVAKAVNLVQRRWDQESATSQANFDRFERRQIEFGHLMEDLRRELEGPAAELSRIDGQISPALRWRNKCPYPGLLPFDEEYAEVYRGREHLVTQLTVKLKNQLSRGGIVVVTGGSGAGKSSLLQAGLLPAVARGDVAEGSADWPRKIMRPTKDPLTALATHLAVLGGTDVAPLRERLLRHPSEAEKVIWEVLLRCLAKSGHPQAQSREVCARLVLIVDQFEEIFTLDPGAVSEAERRAFIAALCAAAKNPVGHGVPPPAAVVIAVRGDFLDRCDPYDELRRELEHGQFRVRPMIESELRRAITGPAAVAGLDIDPGLTETIISELHAQRGRDTSGVLPFLSEAMRLTWENREVNRLTSKGYARTGGVARAVQTSADDAYQQLTSEQQAHARKLLLSMTIASPYGWFLRRAVTRDELYSACQDAERAEVDAILDTFDRKHLIVLDDGAAQLAHDALLDGWPKLRGWLGQDQAALIQYHQVRDAAAHWRYNNQDNSFLYRGARLTAALKAANRWAAETRFPDTTPEMRAFLHAGIRDRRAKRSLLTLGVSLVLVAVIAIINIANRNISRERNIAASEQLAALSQQFDVTDPAYAAQLAASAWRDAPTALARASMLNVLAQPLRATLAASGSGTGIGGPVAFSSDGKILAGVGADGVLRLWDLTTRKQLGAPLAGGPRNAVQAVAFSPDGTTLAAVSAAVSGDSTARLWQVATHRPVGAPMVVGANSTSVYYPAFRVAFSPDGKILAIAGTGSTRLWDLAAGHQIGTPIPTPSDNGPVTLAFSPDGKILVTSANTRSGGIVRLWNLATHRQIAKRIGTGNTVGTTAISPDGKVLAIVSGLGVRLWDLATHRQIGKPIPVSHGIGESTNTAVTVAFSPDGKLLAAGDYDGTAQLWDVATRQPVGELAAGSQWVSSLAFSPDGKLLATDDSDGTIRLWDMNIYRQVGAPMTVRAVYPFARFFAVFNPTAKILVAGNDDSPYVSRWDAATHHQFGTSIDTGEITCPKAISPDGKILATVSDSGRVGLWDVATGRQFRPPFLVSHGSTCDEIAVSPGGKILATAIFNTGKVRLWDIATGHQTGPPITEPDLSPSGMAFSPDGKILATEGSSGTAWLWDVTTHRQIGMPMPASRQFSFLVVAFGPDHKIVVTTGVGGTAWLWNVTTQSLIGPPLTEHTTALSGVAFSPDGSILATAGQDGKAILWDVATGRQIGPPITITTGAYASFPHAVAFSPDGKLLATVGADGVRLWDVAFPRNLLAGVCSIAGPFSYGGQIICH